MDSRISNLERVIGFYGATDEGKLDRFPPGTNGHRFALVVYNPLSSSYSVYQVYDLSDVDSRGNGFKKEYVPKCGVDLDLGLEYYFTPDNRPRPYYETYTLSEEGLPAKYLLQPAEIELV